MGRVPQESQLFNDQEFFFEHIDAKETKDNFVA